MLPQTVHAFRAVRGPPFLDTSLAGRTYKGLTFYKMAGESLLLWGEWGAAAAVRSSIRAFLLKPLQRRLRPVLPAARELHRHHEGVGGLLHGGGGHLARLACGAGWGAGSILCADSVVDAGRVARNDLCLEVYESGPAAARCTGGRANTALAPRCVGARPGHIQALYQQPEIPPAPRAGLGSLAGRARVRRRRPTRRWRRRSGATPVTTESAGLRWSVQGERSWKHSSAGREPCEPSHARRGRPRWRS